MNILENERITKRFSVASKINLYQKINSQNTIRSKAFCYCLETALLAECGVSVRRPDLRVNSVKARSDYVQRSDVSDVLRIPSTNLNNGAFVIANRVTPLLHRTHQLFYGDLPASKAHTC